MKRVKDKIDAHLSAVDAAKEELRRSLVTATNSKVNILTPQRRYILELGIVELLELLKTGKLKPSNVLEAYQVS